jgi:hypothetical protein
MKRRRLANEVQSQEKEIAELRSQLKVLRARTYPSFATSNYSRVKGTNDPLLS